MNAFSATPERYIQAVLHNLHVSPADQERITSDLLGHFQAAQEAGVPFDSVIARLGSPQEIAEAYMAQIPLVFAGFWPRLAAFAIDLLLIITGGWILSLLVLACANLVPKHPSGAGYLVGAPLISSAIGLSLAIFSLIVLYFPILEGRFGRTPGKRLLRLHVLKENGLPIGYKEAFIRRLTYYFEMLPVDALFILFTKKKQRGFDIVARTVVVKQ